MFFLSHAIKNSVFRQFNLLHIVVLQQRRYKIVYIKMKMTHETHEIWLKILMIKCMDIKRYMCLKLHVSPLLIVLVINFIPTHIFYLSFVYDSYSCNHRHFYNACTDLEGAGVPNVVLILLYFFSL